MANKLVTQKEFGAMIGTSQQYISKLVKKGVIKLNKGKIDPAQAKAAMKIASEPTRKSAVNDGLEMTASTSSHHKSLIKSRAIREHYRAGREKLDYEEKSGRLIDRVKYDAAILQAFAARDVVIKKYILSIPDRVARVWPHKETTNELKTMVRKEIITALNELVHVDLDEVKKEMKSNPSILNNKLYNRTQ